MREPFPFQIEAINWLSDRKYALLAYDMGLGKTKIILDALKKSGEKKALVVCKASLISHWKKEAGMENIPAFSYTGNKRNNTLNNFLQSDSGILLLSFQICGKERETLPAKFPVLPVIVDEAHLLTKATSQMTWGIWKLKKSRVWLVTGTPIMNRVEDLFPTLTLLRIFKGKLKDFRNEFMYVDDVIYNSYAEVEIKIWKPEPDSLERIHNMLKYYMCRKTADEFKPSINKVSVKVFSDSEKLLSIRDIKFNLSVSLDKGSHDEILKLITEWRWVSSFPASIEDARFKTLLDIINKIEGKVFVVTAFEQVASKLKSLLLDCDIDSYLISGLISFKKRDKILDSFAKDNVKVLIGVNQACREGLNLPFVNNLIWYDGAWNESGMRQVEDRIRRITSIFKQVNIFCLEEKESPENWLHAIRNKKSIISKALYGGLNLDDSEYYEADEKASISNFI